MELCLGRVDLSAADIVAWSRGVNRVVIEAEAIAAVRRCADAAAEIAQRQPVYGQTTGLGANRDHDVTDDDAGLRMLVSHASAAGAPYPADATRVAVLIRLNQLLRAGSGISPGVVEAMVEILNGDKLPVVRHGGAVGTGDLSALAQVGLALGDHMDARSALPLMSSNAFTLASAALGWERWLRLLAVGHRIAALTALALGANSEAYAEEVQAQRRIDRQRKVAAEMRELLDGSTERPWRVQDPFGLRAYPQVVGVCATALDELARAIEVDVNAALENPMFSDDAVWHHGNWTAQLIALRSDAARLALFSVASLSMSRISDLMDPSLTGATRFLAAGPEPSSGLLMLEYLATAAVNSLAVSAQPAMLGQIRISLGSEAHASFAPDSVEALHGMVDEFQLTMACELVAAVRAIRMRGNTAIVADAPIGDVLGQALASLPAGLTDRPLTDDVDAARALIEQWYADQAG